MGNQVGTKANAMYSALKGTFNAIQGVLTSELVAQKIRVNNISAGTAKTDMPENLTLFSREQIIKGKKKYPLGNGGVFDVADAVTFLLSDANKSVTGISFIPDDGFSIQ